MRTPKNRLVVAGVDLFDEWGLVMTDDYTLGPPKAKTYTVDIPGGDGKVDVTESIAGDVSFSGRAQSFVLLYTGGFGVFEDVKTQLAGFLAGRRYDYALTCDPGYTYTGRFAVDEWYSKMHYGCVKLSVDADPYKLREHRTVRVQANPGELADLECGRQRQCPTFESASAFTVEFGGRSETVQAGTWRFPWLVIKHGHNPVFVSATNVAGDYALSNHGAKALSDLPLRLAGYRNQTPQADGESTAVYVRYDIKEL